MFQPPKAKLTLQRKMVVDMPYYSIVDENDQIHLASFDPEPVVQSFVLLAAQKPDAELFFWDSRDATFGSVHRSDYQHLRQRFVPNEN